MVIIVTVVVMFIMFIILSILFYETGFHISLGERLFIKRELQSKYSREKTWKWLYKTRVMCDENMIVDFILLHTK